LFTDMEGSTRLWENHPELMSAALARHDELVHRLIRADGGSIFSSMGDGVAAAFGSAKDAAHAAMNIQTAIANERWPDPLGPFRVRMGLHTGEAEARGASYYGRSVNRAARVMAIAWGGQVVCTASTASLLVDELELRDLGEHRLRDLSRPEHVWQLGSASFPPLRSGSTLPGNLPIQLTDFVGRQTELEAIRSSIESARLVTLTGVGGAGKTRLALQFAAEAQHRFRDGVWFCDLAPLTSSDAVSPLIGDILGVAPAHGGWTASLVDALARRELLLVLDNCEHVLDAVATLAESLVTNCADVVVLATSREGLDVGGEHLIPVGSLTLPKVGDPPDIARSTDAVSLFISRARDARPLTADDEIIDAIAGVCRRLDGIPLAIELAAARTRSLSVPEIAHHLDHRFRLLVRGSHAALGRHQTLRATIDWSFDLLSETERHVLARASVFAGGFTLDAAVAVCDREMKSEIDILDHVDSLVRRSMLLAEGDGTLTRYRMLETIREYAVERLEREWDAVETRRAHLEWYGAWAREAGEQVRSANDRSWLIQVERELDNMRIALHLAVAVGNFDAATTLLASLPIGALWDTRLGGSIAALAQEVALACEVDHPVHAAVLSLLALDAARRFAGDEAVEAALRAVEVSRRHDNWLRTGPWLALLQASLIAGRTDTLMATAQEALARTIAGDDAFGVAEWHAELGIAHWMTGDTAEAQRLTEIGFRLAETVGAENLIMRNAFLRGVSLLAPGADHPLALRYFDLAVTAGDGVGGNALYGGAAWAVLLANCRRDETSAMALAHELATNLPTPMFIADANGTLVFFNDAAASLLGMPFTTVEPIPLAEWTTALTPRGQGTRIPPDELPLAVAVRQRRPAHNGMLIRGLDGAHRHITVTAIPLQNQRGEHVGAAAIFWKTR
jgi:predicted ATPase